MNPVEFSNLGLQVYGLPEGTDIRHKFKDIVDKHLPSWWDYNEADVNKVIKYIVFLYDFTSPMAIRFPDIKIRRNECAKIAGFTGTLETIEDLHDLSRGAVTPVIGHEKSKNDDEEEEPIYGEPEFIMPKMVVDYCIWRQNKKWIRIMTDESIFIEYTTEALLPITRFKDQKQKLDATLLKSKLREEIEKIETQLEGLYKEVFGADRAVEVARVKATTPERRNRRRRHV